MKSQLKKWLEKEQRKQRRERFTTQTELAALMGYQDARELGKHLQELGIREGNKLSPSAVKRGIGYVLGHYYGRKKVQTILLHKEKVRYIIQMLREHPEEDWRYMTLPPTIEE